MPAPLAALAKRASRSPELDAAFGGAKTLAVPVPARAPVIAAMAQSRPGRLLIATATEREAEALVDDLSLFLDPEGPVAPALLPAWETLPFERVSPDLATMASRALVGDAWRSGGGPAVVVASARSLLQRLAPPSRGERGEGCGH